MKIVLDVSVIIPLIFLGIILIIIGTFLVFISSLKSESKVEGGGAIIIGPIPIVFGTSKKVLHTVLILAIILTTLAIILTLLLYRW